MDMMFIDYLARFGHMVFGVTWIGLLYYFNFVQTEYFKELLDSKTNDEIVALLNNHEFKQYNGELHLSCYTKKLLIEILKGAGFSDVYESSFMQSRYVPMRETPIFDGTHPWMSLYVEARK